LNTKKTKNFFSKKTLFFAPLVKGSGRSGFLSCRLWHGDCFPFRYLHCQRWRLIPLIALSHGPHMGSTWHSIWYSSGISCGLHPTPHMVYMWDNHMGCTWSPCGSDMCDSMCLPYVVYILLLYGSSLLMSYGSHLGIYVVCTRHPIYLTDSVRGCGFHVVSTHVPAFIRIISIFWSQNCPSNE
jgi:hypothetical protein